MRRRGRLGLAALALVTTIAGCGSKAEPGGGASGTTTPTTTPTTEALPRSAPRWETVTSLTGTGDATTDPFTVRANAIQWRARWTCASGPLVVESVPPPKRRPKPVVDGTCSGATPSEAVKAKAIGYSIVTGEVRLAVAADGPWQITIDQQVDTPLVEPPLAGMTDATVLGRGQFYDVEMTGSGTAALYQLPDGTRGLRLDPFQVSNNTELFIWVSEAAAPKTSAEALQTPHVVLGHLKSTLGTENYVLPADLAPSRIRSVVVWCEPVQVAYTAASLTPGG